MEQAVKEDVIPKVKKLIKAPSCCAEARAAGTTWLESIGTEKEAEATKALIAELEMDIIPIDGLIAFAGSEAGAKVFGEEKAKEIEAHAKGNWATDQPVAFELKSAEVKDGGSVWLSIS